LSGSLKADAARRRQATRSGSLDVKSQEDVFPRETNSRRAASPAVIQLAFSRTAPVGRPARLTHSVDVD